MQIYSNRPDRLKRATFVLSGILLGTLAAGGVASRPAFAVPTEPSLTQAPEFIHGLWINSKPTTLAALKGKVVLVTFWTTGCINCRRTLPYWSDWAKRFTPHHDFAVITIHTPETPAERNPAVVRRFAQQHHLTFPILVDSNEKNWDAFGIRYWPTTILIDKKGQIRGGWEGELNFNNSGLYHEVETQIEELRQE